MPAVTIELSFERRTKRTARFQHPDWGAVYIPKAVYRELGRPERLTLTLKAAAAAAVVAPLVVVPAG